MNRCFNKRHPGGFTGDLSCQEIHVNDETRKEVILNAGLYLFTQTERESVCLCVCAGCRALKPIKAIENEPVTHNPLEPCQKVERHFWSGFDCRAQSFKSQLAPSHPETKSDHRVSTGDLVLADSRLPTAGNTGNSRACVGWLIV